MQRFFIDEKLIEKSTLKLSKDIEHQCKHVLRYKNNQIIELIDAYQSKACVKCEFKEEGLFVNIDKVEHVEEDGVKITLIQALIKKDKWEFVLQKATELGVFQIIPLNVSRNVVKWEQKEIESKLKRDQKIIQEAAEQCERTSCPKLYAPINIKELDLFKSELNFVAYEDETQSQLKHCLESKQTVSIVVGPEGGFTMDEIGQLNQMGFKSVSLGKRILRAETASLVCINTIQNIIEP